MTLILRRSLPALLLVGAGIVAGCGGQDGFTESDAATLVRFRKPIQAWNHDSLGWLKETRSHSMSVDRLESFLEKMAVDVRTMRQETARFEDPEVRSQTARLVKAYGAELAGYSKATEAIAAGNPGAVDKAFDALQFASDQQQAASAAILEFFQKKSAQTN